MRVAAIDQQLRALDAILLAHAVGDFVRDAARNADHVESDDHDAPVPAALERQRLRPQRD